VAGKENALMKVPLLLLSAALALFLAGCSGSPSKPGQAADAGMRAARGPADADEVEVEANLLKLPPGDRKLAEAQRWCVIESEHRLGSMGPPFKLEVKGQPVFLCCKGCRKKALAHPDKTLAKVKELKARAAGVSGK
jgi:hypothetical protein